MAALLAWLALRSRTQPAQNERPRRALGKDIRHMVVLGTTNGWLSNVLTAIAVSRVDSAVVAMLQASVPLMVAVLAHFLFVEEPFRPRQLIGIITGLTGILLIVGPVAVFGGRGSLLGIAAMLLAALSYACGTVYGRHISSTNPAALACGQQACGAIMCRYYHPCFEPRQSGTSLPRYGYCWQSSGLSARRCRQRSISAFSRARHQFQPHSSRISSRSGRPCWDGPSSESKSGRWRGWEPGLSWSELSSPPASSLHDFSRFRRRVATA